MKVAHYNPNKLHTLFCEHLQHDEFINNECTSDCDIIYCASVSKLNEAFQAKLKYRKPLICWVWDIPYNWRDWIGDLYQGKEVYQNRDGYVNQIISLLKLCDKVICGSQWTQDTLKRYHIESECTDWYIDIDPLDEHLNPYTEKTPNKIIQVSRFVPHKRFEIGIEAAGVDLPIDCIGFADESSEYYSTIYKHYNKQENVTFYPNISEQERIELMQKASVFVSASVFEGWGLTPAEATYLGIPIILPDIPVFRGFYGDGPVYFEPDSIFSLRDKIYEVLHDETLQESIVGRCNDRIIDCTPEKFSKRWLNIVEKL